MRLRRLILAVCLMGASLLAAAENRVMQDRRQRAAAAFQDGILLIHARSEFPLTGDGFRQDPFFYYFTGLENTVGAILAIDGKSGESWLFLPSKPPLLWTGLQAEVLPGPEAETRFGIDHVVDWFALDGFFGCSCGSDLSPVLRRGFSGFPRTPRQSSEREITRRPQLVAIGPAKVARI